MRNWLDAAGDLVENLLHASPEVLDTVDQDTEKLSLLNSLLSWISN